MRKILFGLLLAGAAAPALAAGGPHDRNDNDDSRPRREAHADHADRGDRDRGERPANVQRPQFNGGQNRPDFQRPQGGGDWQRGDAALNRGGDRPDMHDWSPQQRDAYVQQQIRSQRDQSGNRDRGYGQRYDGQRYGGAYSQRGYPQQRYGNTYDRSRYNGQSPFRADSRRDSRVQWNRDWRNDRRYDWRDRRYRDRSRFHLGLYIDPFGWGYQPYSIGYDLRSNYYQQNYWIDPAMYGLPYPPPGAQWIRYWNDAVLVDMYSGQVIDAIQGFFW